MTRRHGRRRSIRLKGYDYTQPGAYFVTIVTHDRACLFGDIVDGQMRLNEGGRVAQRCWLDIPSHFAHVASDAFVVMPNHVHGILWIVESPNVGAMIPTVGAKNFSPLHSMPQPPTDSPRPSTDSLRQSDDSPQQSDDSPILSGTHGTPHPSTCSPLQSGPPLDDAPRLHGTAKTIGSVVRGFKIGVTKWFRQNTNVDNLWQRNYYEHIIRTDEELNRIREYILTNPLRWHLDRENSAAAGLDDVWESLFHRASGHQSHAGG